MTMLRAITTSHRLVPLRRRPTSPSDPLIERIRNAVIGDDALLEGPFGPRRMVYADATASGRSLTFVEDLIRTPRRRPRAARRRPCARRRAP